MDLWTIHGIEGVLIDVLPLLFVAVLGILCIYDIKFRRIPNQIIIPGIVLLGGLRLWINPLPITNYIITVLIFGSIFFILALVTSEKMGGGDVKLIVFVSLMLGFQHTVISIAIMTIVAFFAALSLIIARRSFTGVLPMAPFITIGAIIALWLGNPIMNWIFTRMISI